MCLEPLADKNDPKYREALEIIRAGRGKLAETPRPDMPGFRLVSPIEIEQEAKYLSRLQVETQMRAAIAQGKKQLPPEADGQ